MCFDTEGSGYLRPEYGFQPEDVIREYFRDRHVRFDCGIVYDAVNRRYRIFSSSEARKMVGMLSQADELVSFNGKRWDLVMLEKQVGRECIDQSLRRIRHHDLSGYKGQYELNELSRSVLPVQEMDRLVQYRRYKAYYETRGFDDFQSSRLSKCRCDVQLTYAVFRRYIVSTPPVTKPSRLP